MITVPSLREDFSAEKMIEITQAEVRLLLWRSLLCGVALGFFYDVIRLIKLFCGVKYGDRAVYKSRFIRAAHFVLAFLTDIIFWVSVGILSIALIYSSTGGIFRGVTYICLAIGFLFYYFTLGRLVLFLNKKIVKLTMRVFMWLAKVLRVPLSFALKGIISLYHLTIGKIIGKIKDKIRTKKKLPNLEQTGEDWDFEEGGKEDFVYVDKKAGYRRSDRINFGAHIERN